MKRSASSKLEIRSQTPNARTKFRQFSPSQRTLTFESPEKNLRPDKISGLERIVSPYRSFVSKTIIYANRLSLDPFQQNSFFHRMQWQQTDWNYLQQSMEPNQFFQLEEKQGQASEQFRPWPILIGLIRTISTKERRREEIFHLLKTHTQSSVNSKKYLALDCFWKTILTFQELNNIQFEKRHLKQLISTVTIRRI